MRLSRWPILIVMVILLTGCAASSPAPGTATPSPAPARTATSTPRPSAAPSPTPAPYPYPMRLEEIGHIGGDATALALSGDRLYVQTGSDHFIVVDVSNPYQPTQIGKSHLLDAQIAALAAYQTYLLVADVAGHVHVLNVSDDANPTVNKVIDVGDRIVDMRVDGRYAYAAARTAGALIIDMGAGGGPQLVGTAKVEGRARHVAQTGNWLVVGSVTVDTKYGTPAPLSPDEDWRTPIPYDAKQNTITLFDISDPSRPAQKNVLPFQGDFDYYYDNMIAEDNLIRIGDNFYDFSDPARPTTLTAGSNLPDVFAAGYEFRYHATHAESTFPQILWIHDTRSSEPLDQVLKAIGSLPEGVVGVSQRLVVRGRYAYLADNEVVTIYDLSCDPRQEVKSLDITNIWWPIAGSLSTDTGTRPDGGGMYFFPQPFCISDSYLYTGKGFWSLEDPAAPWWLAQSMGNTPPCGRLKVNGGAFSQPYGRETFVPSATSFRYAHYGSGILSFLDTSKPGQSVESNVFLTDEPGELVASSGDRLYYMAFDNSDAQAHSILEVFDVTNPYHPRLLGKSEPQPLYMEDDKAWAAGDYLVWQHYEEADMTIVLDVTDPAHIRLGRGDSDAGVLYQAIAGGGYAYKLIGDKQVAIYRVDRLSEPPSVFSLPEHTVPDEYGSKLLVFGDKLYAYGVIVDIADPAQPKVIALAGHIPYEIGVFGDTYYFNLLNEGISIYRLVPN